MTSGGKHSVDCWLACDSVNLGERFLGEFWKKKTIVGRFRGRIVGKRSEGRNNCINNVTNNCVDAL